MKILDPGSVVRESEFANAQNTGSAFERGWSLYNRVRLGTRLTESQRADFFNNARRMYESGQQTYEKVLGEYSDLVERYGLDKANVMLGDFTDIGVIPTLTVPDLPTSLPPIPQKFKELYMGPGRTPPSPDELQREWELWWAQADETDKRGMV